MATITHDTLDWYGFDNDGGAVHDVIGTRCDPYTNNLISNNQYHYCCHSNLTRALVKDRNLQKDEAENLVHDGDRGCDDSADADKIPNHVS